MNTDKAIWWQILMVKTFWKRLNFLQEQCSRATKKVELVGYKNIIRK